MKKQETFSLDNQTKIMVNVFGSKKMAIVFFVSMSMGILIFLYDYFGVLPTNDFSKSQYYYLGALFFIVPGKFLFIDIIGKVVNKHRIKKDEKSI